MARLVLMLVALALPAAAQTGAGGNRPAEIRFGLYVTSLSGIQPSDGSFAVGGYAWFIAPPGARFDAERDVELLSRQSDLRAFAADTLPDGRRYSAVTFSAVIDHGYDMRDFPFDRQDLRLQFEAAQPAAAIAFIPDDADSRIAPEVRAPGFRVVDLTLAPRIVAYDTGFGHRGGHSEFSRLVATLRLERNISPLLFEKFTGYFVAFVIAALVVFVPVSELGTRVGMTTGSIFAAVLNLYRLEDGIGFDAVFGLVDQASVLVFSQIVLQLMLSLWMHHRFRTGRHDVAERVNLLAGGAVTVVHGVLILGVFALALR